MILCHIVGINNLIKQKFIQELTSGYNNIYFCDLDIITNDIRNGRKLVSLTKAIESSKNNTNKKKELVKELNSYWKDALNKRLNAEITNNKNKKIIILGLSTFHLNHKTRINIDTPNKYFLKINIKTNAKEIVEYNLKKYKHYIIDGTFPIKYLDHDFLIKQREKLIAIYEKMNYVMKTYSTLLKWFEIVLKDHTKQIGGYSNKIDNLLMSDYNVNLWVSSPKRYEDCVKVDTESVHKPPKRKSRTDIERFIKKEFGMKIDKPITGYKEKWLAVLSSIKDNNKYFRKGYIQDGGQNKPYIKERFAGALKHLSTSCYLYGVECNSPEKINSFKYRFNNESPFKKRKFIHDIHNYLKDHGVKIIKFRYV